MAESEVRVDVRFYSFDRDGRGGRFGGHGWHVRSAARPRWDDRFEVRGRDVRLVHPHSVAHREAHGLGARRVESPLN
ncbi:MAG: hypothetical protein WAK12_09030, partial [Acidimicrobiales bacterium]